MARDLAIDLGTANTLVYARGEGIILNEPTVIALDSRTNEVLAIGHDAWQMIGRTPEYIVAVRPLRGGAITDFEITERLIRRLFQRAGGSAFATDDQYKAEVRGRDLTTGTAKVVVLSPEEVREAVDEPVRAIIEIIVRALGQTPPELAQDL